MIRPIIALISFVPMLFAIGCGNSESSQVKPGDQNNPKSSEGHSHVAPHGGIVKTVGQNHVELTFDSKNGTLTFYVLGDNEQEAYPVDAAPMKIQVKRTDREDFDAFIAVVLDPIPQEGEPKGKTSRFAGSHADLIGAISFEATLHPKIDGKAYRTLFQVDATSFSEVFLCPMRCEKNKVYAKAGKCPICKMDMKHPQSAHADHSSKHGGLLFMASNSWHHLEGVLPKADEFRLYLYNDHTKPISAKPFVEGSYIEASRVDADRKALGEPVKVPFTVAPDGTYLVAAIPRDLSLPIDITVRLKFEGKDRPDLYNFTFDQVSPFVE